MNSNHVIEKSVHYSDNGRVVCMCSNTPNFVVKIMNGELP